MKKGAKLGLLGLAAGIGAGTAGSLAAVGNALYNQFMVPIPRDSPINEKEPPLQQEGRRWALQGRDFQEVSIRAVDGLDLRGVFLPAESQPHRWAICVHGLKDYHVAMGPWGKRFHQEGWNVLMPDQRGYGKSEGDCIGWGFVERLDLISWISWVVRRDPAAEILLLGVSMGAATVLMATGGALPKNVRAAVSDCSYATIESEMRHVAEDMRRTSKRLPPIPAPVLFSLLRSTTLRRMGYDLRDASPLEAVERSSTPTLFIHGTRDELVPPAMMGKLFQAAKCPKSFLWVPNAGHAVALGTDPDLYWSTVDTFLEGYFS